MDNQRNYQALFRDAETGAEPFVGFIVGPYDLRLPSPASKVQTFVARKQQGEDKPFELDWTVVAEAPGTDALAALRKARCVRTERTGVRGGNMIPERIWEKSWAPRDGALGRSRSDGKRAARRIACAHAQPPSRALGPTLD